MLDDSAVNPSSGAAGAHAAAEMNDADTPQAPKNPRLRWTRVLASLIAAAVPVVGLTGCETGDQSMVSAGATGTDAGPPADIAVADTPTDVVSPAAVAAVLDDSNVLINPWQYKQFTGQHTQTPNYDLYVTVRSDRFRKRLPIFAEAALAHYRTAITPLPAPPQRLDTFVFRNRDEWSVKTREVIPQQASQLRNLGRGGFSTRGIAVLYDIDWRGDRDTLAITAHEGWHQYTQRTFKQSLPMWLEEGIATYVEGHYFPPSSEAPPPVFRPWRNYERRSALRSVLRGRERGWVIPLEDLITKKPQEFLAENRNALLGYYGQVWVLTHFLMGYEDGKYRAGLQEAVADAAAGRLVKRIATSPQVLARGGRGEVLRGNYGKWLIYAYITDDLETLEDEYLDWAMAESTKTQNRR